MYRMARAPYYRGPSTLSKKPTPSLSKSKPAWELEGSNGSKMGRSSVLDNLGSGGPIHRIQRKANLHLTPSLKSSQRAWELEGSNGSKMDFEVLDDDNHIPLLEGSTSFLIGHGEEVSPLRIDYCTLD
nr:nuclear pore complex protein NUP1-like [Tanacetum cinerariifolium]